MSLDGKVGRLATQEKTIITGDHPPVLLSASLPTGAGVWPAGTILWRPGTGYLLRWDGQNGNPMGVLIDDVDTNTFGSAVYLAHGTVNAKELKLTLGDVPTPEELYRLAEAGIYAV